MGGEDSEKILLRTGGKIYDLLFGSRAVFGANFAEYYGEAHGIKTKVRISVPERGSVKRIRVFCEGGEECDAEIAYFIIPALYSDSSAEQLVKSERIAGGVCLKNPQNASVSGYAFLTAAGGADFCASDREGFLAGEWGDGADLPRAYPCAAVGKK